MAAPTVSSWTGKISKSIGEPDHRLYDLNAWEEGPFYTDRERAPLAGTEAVTRVAESHFPTRYPKKFASISAKGSLPT